MTSKLTSYQRAKFKQAMDQFEHGLLTLDGKQVVDREAALKMAISRARMAGLKDYEVNGNDLGK